MLDPVAVVEAYGEAFNARDADALVALTDEDVELVSPRGVDRGHGAVRDAVARQTYGVGMHLVPGRFFHRGDLVVAEGAVELRFVASGELADRFAACAIYTVRDGRVTRVDPRLDLASALAAAGLAEADAVPRD